MNYRMHYDRLIQRARNRILTGYKENHHIIPRCHGGTDEDINLVALTAEEHFVAHQLLIKIYPNDKKLLNAISRMICSSSKNKRNNKWYGWIRKRYAQTVSGENNPSAKFTNSEVLDIYHSTDTIENLTKKYNVVRYNIITIKRKIYYRSVTKDIKELPGCSNEDLYKKGGGFPIPIDLIEDIFYDTGDYSYFWERYRATERVVQGIKNKKTFKKITSKLGTPGQVKRYGMTRDEVEAVYNATGTNADISVRFGIHYNTVRNIKGKNSRAFNMWEEW